MSKTIARAEPGLPRLCPNPIFIVGSPRSGTSILAWALAQHSQLWGSGELHLLYGLFGNEGFDERLRREQALPEGFFEMERVDRAELLGYLGLGLNALITSRSGGKRWIEQTPVNTMMVDRLLELFPGAYFLHILRDGRAVVNSMMNFIHALPEEQRDVVRKNGWYPRWAVDFREACTTWKESVETAMSFAALHPDRCLTISYRHLVEAPEQGFRAIARFLAIPHEEATAEYFRCTRMHSSVPGATGAAVARRGDPWVDWTTEQRELFMEIATPTLIRHGLVSDEDLAEWREAVRRKEVDAVRRVTASITPVGSRIAVASRGDDDLLALEERIGMHFPQEEDGVYAGHYPGDSEEAITQVEALRSRGADFLLFPPSGRWWLDHYAGLRSHLATLYPRLPEQRAGALFDLRARRPGPVPPEAGDPAHPAVQVELAESERVDFVCNVCGSQGVIARAQLFREGRSCSRCGSSVRWRSVVHTLSMELFGESRLLADFPERKDIIGVGMTDWPGYAETLAARFSYTNTFFEQNPKLDVSAAELGEEWVGKHDFVISSDVLEHVAPPVSTAFVNLRKLLKPGGVLVLTVPFSSRKETVEHFPELFDYRVETEGDRHVLVNRTREGAVQTFDELSFHGGPGAVLEMRQFGEADLVKELRSAGFDGIRIHRSPVFEHAIYCDRCWPEGRSFTISARATGP